MSEVLYRKYRPQKFGEVINQEVVKTILQNALKEGKVSHAYLFTGPRGVGKTTIARILAKAVNCEKLSKGGEPCTKCDNCQQISSGRFLDLIEIDAASYTGVDNIRDIIDHTRFAPSRGKYKVFIIDEVHMLSKAAFNALLKTLEEPPVHALFILATTEVHKVPATISSRTQRFDFQAVSQRDILELLERVLKEQSVKIAPEALRLIAQAATGSLRDALSILDQVLSFGGDEVALEQVEEILGLTRIEIHQELLDLIEQKDTKGAVQLIKDLPLAGKDLVQFAHGFLEYLRWVLLVKTNAESLEDLGLVAEEGQRLLKQAKAISGADLLQIIKKILLAYRETKQAPVVELPLLAVVMELTELPENTENNVIASPPERTKQSQTGQLHLGRILDQWAQVLTRVKEYNHSLIASLRLGRVVSLQEQNLLIAFPYAFHKETIEDRKNKIVVEQVLEDVFSQKLRLKVCLERELEQHLPAGQKEADLVGEAMKVLGNRNE